MKSLLNIEEHPLEPFLPVNAKLLMLGSFPPQKKRWSMEFFYPNLQNDMWRIFGIIFFQNKDHFLNPDKRYLTRNVLLIFWTKRHRTLWYRFSCSPFTGQCLRQISGSCRTDRYQFATEADSNVQGHCNHRTKSNGYYSWTNKGKRTRCRNQWTFRIRRPDNAIIQNAFVQPCLPVAHWKKSAIYRVMFNELGLLNE